MGNLLGSPVLDKETHEGVTADGIQYAVSSMQGWRVHMEDAHIAEPNLFAAERIDEENSATNNNSNSSNNNNADPAGGDNNNDQDNDATNVFTTIMGHRYRKLELPGHALFGVFDGHGGTFAAAYAGRNFLRVLSRQPKFVAYAKFVKERPKLEAQLQGTARRVQLKRSGLELLEGALCDAFIDLDRELARAARRLPNPESNTPYHVNTAGGSSGSGSGGAEQPATPSVSNHSYDAHLEASARSNEDEGDSGTTACVVLVTPELVVCANAGDSRAVFSKLGHKAVPLSYDHKPDDEEEERRIRAAGGYVAGGRVEGDLAVSRGFGDFRFKVMDTVLQGSGIGSFAKPGPEAPNRLMRHEDQKVSAVPDIIIQNRSLDQDEFIIIACDGIWDVQTNYEGVKAVAEIFEEGETKVALACEELCDLCLKLGSKDNMTALIIRFPGQRSGQGGGVLARRQQRDEPATTATMMTTNNYNNASGAGNNNEEAKTEVADYSYPFKN